MSRTSKASARRKLRSARLPFSRASRLEPLEPRRVLAAISWTGNGDGSSWNNAANWGGVVPGASDDVTISKTGVGTINISGDSFGVHSLNDTTAPLNIASGASLSLAAAPATSTFGQSVNVAAGASLSVGASAALLLSAKTTLTIGGSASFAGGDTVTLDATPYGSTTQIVVNGTLTATQTSFVQTGNYTTKLLVNSGGELVASNDTFALGQLYLDNGAVVKATDLSNNTFNLPLYLPASDVAMLSAASGGSDNKSFRDIDILPGTLSTGALNLNVIGAQTTANLRYVFPGNFTVAGGSSLNVAANLPVLLQANATLTVGGSANFASGDTVTLDASPYGSLTQIVVDGALSATGTSFVQTGTYSTKLLVDAAGELIAANDTFALGQLYFDNGAVVKAADLSNNTFNLPLYLPAVEVAMLSAAGGGSDNKSFRDVNILAGTLSTGTLNLNAIGTQTTANLRYVFPGSFTVAAGASLHVAGNLPVLLQANTTLTIDGAANFAGGDAVTLDASPYGSQTQIVVDGTLTATRTAFVQTGTYSTKLLVDSGGELIASNDTFSLGQLYLDNGAVVKATDLSQNTFNLPLYLPFNDLVMLSAAGGGSDNKSFHDVDILVGNLSSGQLNLNVIGTDSTANLRYVFPGGFTVAVGASLNVAANLPVLLQSNATLTVNGWANFAGGDMVTLDSSSYGSQTQIVVDGTLTATGTSFVKTGTYAAGLLVNSGGELVASSDTFSAGQLYFDNGAVVKATDLSNNTFNLSLYLPYSDLAMLSAASGGSDNKSFNDIDILAGTLSSGQLNLNVIGTQSTANLRYVFPESFTVATVASLNVAPGVSVYFPETSFSANTFTINGSATFASGDTVTLSDSGFGSSTQIVVNGTLSASGTAFNQTAGSNAHITVDSGGELVASGNTFSLAGVTLNDGAIVNPSDLANNAFNTTLALPAIDLAMLSAAGGGSDNKSFHDIDILAGTLSSGELNLNVIGTQSTASLRYVFAGSFTVAAGASLNVAPNVSVYLPMVPFAANTLTINGSATFANGDTVALDPSDSLSATQISVSGTFTATDTSFVQAAGNNTVILNNGTFLGLGNADTVSSIVINGTGQFSVSPTTTLNVSRNVLGTPQVPSNFTPNGVVDLSGAGTSSSPQLFQAMSVDKGNNGFFNNYAYTSIVVGNTTYVKLQGVSGQAVYTNSINVLKGTTLNLNGLNLYARVVNIAGTVTGGTITQVTGGGQIAVGATVAGDIANIGNVDDWTFTGLGGDKVTVLLDPGSGTATGPIGAPLEWVKVELLDASNNVLASATSTTNGTPLALENVQLPANGTYTIRVQAAPAESSSVGNYVLGLSDVQSSVAGLPATTTSLSFPVTWTGGDGAGEYPIAAYDIYVSDNGGPFTPWLTATPQTSASYLGLNGHTYSFYSVATDAAGNRQPTPTAAEATTTIALASSMITWSNPANIVYGNALGATQLDATANVPGTFRYTLADGTTPANGAVLKAGANQTLNVVFTPNDTNDYTVATAQVAINVNPATLTVTADDAGKTYGTANPAFSDKISGFVNGDNLSVVSGSASLTTAANIASPVGSYPITATLGTLSAANYSFAFQSGTLSVTLAAPVITWNNPADMTYGQPLGVGQLDATANVPGSFTYTLADGKTAALGAVLNAGQNQTLNVVFTPNDTVDYPTATAHVQINVDAATLTVTANNASRAFGAANPTFTDTISGFVNGDNLSVVSGAASLTTAAAPSSTVGNYSITAAQGTLSAANYDFTFVSGTLTVSQAVPVLTWSVPADIIYGKALSPAQLDATANVPGTFSYTLADGTTPASGAVLQAGPNQTLRVAFTPSDATDYAVAAAQVEINVGRATLTVKANDASRMYASSNPAFADTISGFVNGDGPGAVSGAASLTTTANIASPVGAYPITAGLGTLSAADYDFAFQDGTLNITLGAPVIAWNNPAKITYGQSLGVAQLNASANVPGTFTYTLADGKTPAAGAVLNAGQNQALNVTFTPNDATDYPTATAQVQITVDPAKLTVAANDVSRAYGATNPTFTDAISGFVNGDNSSVVSGAASLTTTAALNSAVGNYSITAAQGTLSAANYTFIFVSGSLAVTQVAPVVSWGAPADIIYGAALGGSQLDATANVPGTFSYTLADGTTPAAGAVLHVGANQTLIVTFTPTDTVDYAVATAQVVINVAPATLTVTPNDASRVFGGANPLFADTISGFVNGDSLSVVSGAASLSSSATIISAAGNYSIAAALGTLSAADYVFVFESATLTVTRATPAVSWINPTDIIYGHALGGAQLDATASVQGTFNYTLADGVTPAAGAVLDAGRNQTLIVTFTPTDTIDYTTVTARVEINVAPAVLVVTASDASRGYGMANPTFADTISGFVNGDGPSVVSGAASLTTTASTNSALGNYTITAALGALTAANYTFSFQSGTLTVTQATPVLIWSDPADISYGSALGGSQLDASANVPGTFSYTLADGTTPASGVVLQAGLNQTLNVVFTPVDTTDYAAAAAQVAINVAPATLTVKANDASRIYASSNPTFTDTISGFVNGDGAGVVSGAASLSTTANIASSAGAYPILAGPGTLSAANYKFAFQDGTLNVGLAAPAITWNKPADITYGQPLGAGALNAASNVPGSFTYTLADGTTPAAGAVLNAGQNQTLNVVFTPADAKDYSSSTAQVEINVARAALTVTANDASRAYGSANPTLTDTISGFVNGDSPSVVGGAANLMTTANIASPLGVYPITVGAGTLNAANYNFFFQNGTLTVTQAAPLITWAVPADITYGAALGSSQLDATANVPGTFSYTLADGTTPAVGAVLQAGPNQTLNVTFTPTDTTAYTAAAAQVAIKVDPATLTVKANDASRIYAASNPTFTDTISGFVNGDGPGVVSGAASLTTSANIASAVGAYPIAAGVGTLSAANYDFTFQSGTLNVTLAAPVITWSNPAGITYGTPLSVGQLNASANVPGSFNYTLADGATPAAGAVLSAGQNQTLNVIFTPADTTDYSSAAAQVKINVDPATLTVTANDASRAYATSNPTFTDAISGFVHGDGPGVVSGAASLTTTANIASPVGAYPITAAQGTLNAANYNFAFRSGTLNVSLVAPEITWNNPADITYGAALGAAQLDAAANVPGTFSYKLADGTTPASGAVLNAGPNQTLNVTFTPTDATDYATAAAQVKINVAPAILTVSANDASKVFGAANPAFADTISGFVNGDGPDMVSGAPMLTTTATATSHVGAYPITAALGTLSAANYAFTFQSGTLTVMVATPNVAWPTPSDIIYGTALGSTQLNATAGAPGSFSYTLADGTTAASGAVLHAGASQTLKVAFTPADTNDYATTASQVQINVLPATLTVKANGASRPYGAANPTFADTIAGFVNGDGPGVVNGAASLTTTATSTSPVGSYPITAALGTLSAADYVFAFQSGTLTVTVATPNVAWPTPGDITYGAALGSTQLNATANAPGSFSYTLADGTTPASGKVLHSGPNQTLNVAFTPADATDYAPVTRQVQLNVDPATLKVKANDASRYYGAANPTFTDTITGFVNGDGAGVVSGAASLTTTATSTSAVGSYPITAALGTLSATDYVFAFQNGALTVTQAPLTGSAATIPPGTNISGPIAFFSDANTSDPISDFSASINWGDGQTSAGNIVAGTGAGQFQVVGSHHYADNSPHTITVSVTRGAEQPLVVHSSEPGQTINLLGSFGVSEDTYVIGSGQVSAAAANGVLANDTAPGPLTVTTASVTGANGGTFVFHIDGSFTYTPPANFPGFDSVKYTARDAQGDAASAAVNVLSQTGGVVWKFYESVLHRDPDPAGLQYWIKDIVNGGKTGDIAAAFFESDELLNEIITSYYQQYLFRTPDDSGLAYWRGVWHATGGPEGIKAGLADSPEFYASAGGTPQAWIAELYRRVLNRTPDSQGEQYWLSYLASQGNTESARNHVALAFFTSLEAYQGDVTGWFREYLQRAPTQSELNHYAQEMQAGSTDRDIEQEITNLPEYGQNPPPAPAGTAVRLPDYLPQQTSNSTQSSVAAKDSLFAKLGG